jgi:hypothetical protein
MAYPPPKTVVVLGASYGGPYLLVFKSSDTSNLEFLVYIGARAAQIIAAGLPEGWRLVLIDRNSYVSVSSLWCTYDEWILLQTPQSYVL